MKKDKPSPQTKGRRPSRLRGTTRIAYQIRRSFRRNAAPRPALHGRLPGGCEKAGQRASQPRALFLCAPRNPHWPGYRHAVFFLMLFYYNSNPHVVNNQFFFSVCTAQKAADKSAADEAYRWTANAVRSIQAVLFVHFPEKPAILCGGPCDAGNTQR